MPQGVELGQAFHGFGLVSGRREGGHKDGEEQGHDADHHQQLNDGESTPFIVWGPTRVR